MYDEDEVSEMATQIELEDPARADWKKNKHYDLYLSNCKFDFMLLIFTFSNFLALSHSHLRPPVFTVVRIGQSLSFCVVMCSSLNVRLFFSF